MTMEYTRSHASNDHYTTATPIARIVPYTLSSLNSAKYVLFQTGSPGSLPVQNCYLYQRKLPCDYKAERP